MELISTLKSEINLKKEQFEKEIELLSGLSEYIENKTEFSKVWHTLLKCDIVNTDLARELVAYYFNMPLDVISVTPGRIIIKFNKKCSYELYWGNIVFTPNIVQKDISSIFFVEAKVPFVWNQLIREKKPFKKSETYEIAEEFIRLTNDKAPLSKMLDFRYEGMPKVRQYFLYFTKGRKKDKERGLSYYQDRIDNEHKRYQEYCEKWDKDTANALNEFLEFYAEIYPIIQQNFSSEYSRIKYNVDIDKIIDKLKGMGEII
jgi:hypothetical protein